MPEKKAPRYWVAHSGEIHYVSTRTGKPVSRAPYEIIDDLPAVSVIEGVSGPNWVITEGLVVAYKGDAPTGHKLPKDERPDLEPAPEPDTVVTEPAPVVTAPPIILLDEEAK